LKTCMLYRTSTASSTYGGEPSDCETDGSINPLAILAWILCSRWFAQRTASYHVRQNKQCVVLYEFTGFQLIACAVMMRWRYSGFPIRGKQLWSAFLSKTTTKCEHSVEYRKPPVSKFMRYYQKLERNRGMVWSAFCAWLYQKFQKVILRQRMIAVRLWRAYGVC
jgi:hypothetical protein